MSLTSKTDINKHISVWCDKKSDMDLWKEIVEGDEILGGITNVDVLPNYGAILSSNSMKNMRELVVNDRFDYIICYDNKPILCIEITEHGYTGDNPLQRFARLAMASELHIPSIYITPYSRTRLDELEESDKTTSLRRVSARVFQGMIKLQKMYNVPNISIDWPTNARGQPIPMHKNKEPIKSLVKITKHLITQHYRDILDKKNILSCSYLQPFIKDTKLQSESGNVRESEIRIPNIDGNTILKIIEDPRRIIKLISSEYFMKGKSDKIIALSAIEHSKIYVVEQPNGKFESIDNREIKKLIPNEIFDRPNLILYNGYQWRSEPNGGIAANTYVLYCQNEDIPDRKHNYQNLVIYWPRVFLSKNSIIRKKLLLELQNFEKKHSWDQLSNKSVFEEKLYQKHLKNPNARFPSHIQFRENHYGVWNKKSTVARIYRKYATLIILNDAVLIGNHLKSRFTAKVG